MRPEGVESNHFAYHLDQLMKVGYVAKENRNYYLTTKGKILVDRSSHDKMSVRIQPHIVTSVYIQNEAGKTVVYQHNFQPYLGLYGAPQGRVHYDEKIASAASRELKEKTGLENIPLAHRGIVYIRTTSGDEVINILLAHIFSGRVSGESDLATESKSGKPEWIDTSTLRDNVFMPGFKHIEAKLSDNDTTLFFDEIDFALA